MSAVLDILGSVGFDWRIALVNLINFFIVFYLLNRYVFSGLRRVMDERKALIDKGLEDAEQSALVLAEAHNARDEMIKEGQAKAHSIMAEAQHTGNMLIKKAEERSVEQCNMLIDKATKEIEEAKIAATRALEKETRQLVATGVERILQERLNGPSDAAYIETMLKKQAK